MTTFILRRITQVIPVLVLASVAVFLLIHLVPGDPATMLAGPDATPDMVAAVRTSMGLDAPLPVQYALWMQHALSGDLGKSYISRLPVTQLIGNALPATLELALAALLIAVVFGIPSGILSAVNRQSMPDWLITVFNGMALAIPNFWLGIVLILLLSQFAPGFASLGYAPLAEEVRSKVAASVAAIA